MFSVPPGALEPDSFTDGIDFYGSSIRGFQKIQESDMLIIPNPTTAFLAHSQQRERGTMILSQAQASGRSRGAAAAGGRRPAGSGTS
jgi:glutamine synthetase